MRIIIACLSAILCLAPTVGHAQVNEACVATEASPAEQRHATLLHTFTRSDEEIQDVRFSRDGARVAVGQNDNRVRVWDVASGALLMQSRRLRGPLWNVVFTDDGESVISYGPEDREINRYIWSVADGAGEHTEDWSLTFDLSTRSLTHSADSRDRTRRYERGQLLDPATGREIADLATLPGSSYSNPAFSYDNSTLVVSTPSETGVFDARTGRLIARLCGATSRLPHPRVSPDGQFVVAPEDTPSRQPLSIGIWNARTGALVARISAPRGSVWGIDISVGGGMVATGSTDGRARVWKLESGTGPTPAIESAVPEVVYADDETAARIAAPQRIVRVHSAVRSLYVGPDGSSLAFLTQGDEVGFWHIGSATARVIGATQERFLLGVGQPCSYWASVEEPTSFVLRNWRDGAPSRTFWANDGAEFLGLQKGANCREVLTTVSDGTVRLWSTRSGRQIWSFAPDDTAPVFASYDPSRDAILVVDDDQQVHQVSRGSAQDVRSVRVTGIDDLLGAWPISGTELVLVVGASGFATWDRQRDRVRSTIYPAPQALISDDGTVFLLTSALPFLSRAPPQVVDLSRGLAIDLVSARFQTSAIALSRDGTLAAAGSENGVVRVWRVVDGKLLVVFGAEGAPPIRALAISGPPVSLYSGDGQGNISEWRLPEAR